MPKEKKTRNVKPDSKVRERVDLDSKFSYVLLTVLKANLIENQDWTESFIYQLLCVNPNGNRPVFSHHLRMIDHMIMRNSYVCIEKYLNVVLGCLSHDLEKTYLEVGILHQCS
jgi:hypothetical protein